MKKNRTLLISCLIVLSLLFLSSSAYPLPEGQQVVSGSAKFSQPDATTLNINTSDRVIINYQSFSIAQPETVQFIQPSSSSIALNRVVGVSPSSILGNLRANGRIVLTNPNGILFGPNSRVDVAGLVASTLNIANDDFLNGRFNFQGKGGYILNQGNLVARPGGYICLMAGAVENQGLVQADLGTAVLASGEKLTLNLDDAGSISVVIDEGVGEEIFGPDGEKIDSAIKNSGKVQANGGKVILTAKVLNNVFDYAINNSGIVEAKSLAEKDGEIVLAATGAPIINTGKIEAGDVKIEIEDSDFINEGEVITDGTNGAADAGNIYIEAINILQSGLISANAFNEGNAGEIEIISVLSTVLDENSTTSAACPYAIGNGGRIYVNSKRGNTTVFNNALIDVSAGSIKGDSGFIEVSAHAQLGFHGILSGRAPPGYQSATILFDPANIFINSGGQSVTPPVEYLDPPQDLGISNASLEGFSGHILLQATNSITLVDPLNLTSASIQLEAYNNININANLTANGGIVLTADSDGSGVGVFTLAADKIIQNNISGNIEISGVKVKLLGTINSAGNLTITGIPINSSDTNSIQTAINAIGTVGGTSTINVIAGTYNENLIINKSLILNGAQANVDPRPSQGGRTGDESIIDAQEGSSYVIRITASDVEINGFTITGGTGDMVEESGSADNLLFQYNILYDDLASSGDEAIQIKYSTGVVIQYNYTYNILQDAFNLSSSSNGAVRYNEAHDIYTENAAIYCYDATDIDIIGNLIYDVPNNDGIKLGDSGDGSTGGIVKDNIVHDAAEDGITIYASGVTIDNNTIYNCGSENGALYLYLADNSSVINNQIYNNNAIGLLIHNSDNITVAGNVIYNNDDTDDTKYPGSAGIWLTSSATNIAINNDSIYGNADYELKNENSSVVDASANWWGSDDPTIVTGMISGLVDFTPLVESSTDTDDTTPGFQPDLSSLTVHTLGQQIGTTGRIQEAIDLVDGSTVNVTAGTYAEQVIIDKQLSLNGANTDVNAVTGTRGSESIIDGGTSTAITISADDVIVDGFTLDGGITLDDLVNPISGGTISNNIITGADNNSEPIKAQNGIRVGFDAGLGVDGVTIEGNTISNNLEKGIRFANPKLGGGTASYITISGNKIENNGSAGIETYGPGHNTIINNTISGNDGNGINLKFDDGDVVTGNTITNNTGPGITLRQVTNTFVENNNVSGHQSPEVINTCPTVIGGKGSGIHIFDTSEDNIIRFNDISGNNYGVFIHSKDSLQPSNNSIIYNNIAGNIIYGVFNALVDPPAPVDATKNYWGDATGPEHTTTNTFALGNSVSDNVDYSPWWGANYVGDLHTLTWTWYTNDSIQDAIDVASNTVQDTINVLAGTYAGDVDINKDLTLGLFDGDVTSTGNFTNSSGTLDVNGNTLTIIGNLYNYSCLISSAGDIILDISGDAEIAKISAPGHQVTITAGGSILDGDLGTALTDIIANNITLNVGSAGSIGAAGEGEEIDLDYSGTVTKNVNPTSPTDLDSSSHITSTWTNDNTVTVSWTVAIDPSYYTDSGIAGYSIVWDTNSGTIPNTTKDIEDLTSTTSPDLGDGNSHYLHIRAVDNSGNWSTVTAHIGPFFTDITPPVVTITTPLPGTYSDAQALAYEVSDNLDPSPTLSGVASGTLRDTDGTYNILITATDWASNISSDSVTFTIVLPETVSPLLTDNINPARTLENVPLVIGGYRMSSFNPTPTFYFYHPLTPVDSSAFDDIILDEGAYEFIEDTLKFKKSLPLYYSPVS
ncbi:MAG: right-handed parallel beta-helix repeat-containing protein [Candidatus Omnitrophica bacterium]|nr:right-handed parallel beta-helix repeat-containing protein [Candidatus Omnitrophota bacterium]